MPDSESPIRIAFCITDLDAGGAERALVQLVTRLDRSRWEPFVFCLASEGELAAVLREAGIMVACLGANRNRNLGVVWRLSRQLVKVQPELLQTFLYHANIAGRLAGRIARVPYIVSGIRVAEKRSRFRLWLDRATDRLVQKHVCVSQEVAAFSIGEGRLSAAKVQVIPNGVDSRKYAEAAPADLSEFGIPVGSRTLLFVGRLDPQKGPFVLLYAVKSLLEEHPDLHVLFVGDGPLREQIRTWTSKEQLGSRVHLAGRRNDVPAILKAANLFVLPSQWEGQPNVVLEAMAAGVPVIATQVEGIHDLVVPERTGLVVSPNSPHELSVAIETLLGDATLAKKMAKAAQDSVVECFTWEQVVEKYDDLYCQILGLAENSSRSARVPSSR